MVFLMLVVNLDSLKLSVSVGNWFQIHGMEKNNFTRLIWTKGWHMEVQVSVMFVKLCICSSKCLLYKLRLRTFCESFLEKLELSVLGIVYGNNRELRLHVFSDPGPDPAITKLYVRVKGEQTDFLISWFLVISVISRDFRDFPWFPWFLVISLISRDFSWFLVISDDFWWFLMISMISDDFWWFLMISMISDDFWWFPWFLMISMISDDFYWFLMISNWFLASIKFSAFFIPCEKRLSCMLILP
jgi:hypothetical protein